MAKIFAVVNQKGGVGKTTTVVNLGAALASFYRQKVLLVDLDGQANLTISLGVPIDGSLPTIYEVLKGEKTINQIIRQRKPLYLAPANLSMTAIDVELASKIGRELLLKNALAEVSSKFDWIFCDCPPSLGVATFNALVAAEKALLILEPEYLALQGTKKILENVEVIKDILNSKLDIGGVLINKYDRRRKLTFEVEKIIRDFFGEAVLKTTIGENVDLAEAPSYQKTILEYSHKSSGAKDFKKLAKELMEKFKEKKRTSTAKTHTSPS